MAVEVLQTIPILRIFSLEKAKEFYVGFLGFQVDWEHRFDPDSPVYLQVSRDRCVLHLSEHHGDCCPGGNVFVRLTGIDEYHRELTAKAYKYYRPGVELAPWGAKCMEVIDPFGNHLRFNEDV